MLDRILASISMLGLIVFMGWVTTRVMEPDLWVVTITILAIAIYYFWDELRAGGSHLSSDRRDDRER